MTQVHKVYIARFPIDFRFGINRLLSFALHANLSPQSGDVVVFSGKNKKRFKILHGDATGLWLSLKIFTSDEARSRVVFLDNEQMSVISSADLACLLEGKRDLESLSPNK